MHSRFNTVILVALLISSGIIASYVSSSGAYAAGEPSVGTSATDGGASFRYGTIGANHESLDPAVDYEIVGGETLQNVYETLVFYNGSSSSDLKPMLASAMPEISENGLYYNFTLRQGVKFSDNKTEMTSADVKYSFDRGLLLNDPHGPFWMYGAVLIPGYYKYDAGKFGDDGKLLVDPVTENKMDKNGKDIVNKTTGVTETVTHIFINQSLLDQHIWAKSKYEVQFNLTMPYAPFLSALASNAGSVVSKAYVEANGGLTKAGYDHMASNTMGTGPYALEEYKVDSHYKLVANEYYWRGVANIKTIMIEQIPDTNARIMALKNGELDAAFVPRDQKGSVENVAGLKIVSGNPTFNIDFLGLNQAINTDKLDSALTNVPSDFFADRNVRLAFAHAFNYKTYIDETFQGMAIQPNGAIPQGMFGYSDNVPVYDYNLEKAKEYLAEAIDNKTGKNWLDQGFKLEVFFNGGNTARETACMQIKAGLEALAPGKITVTVTPLEWSAYLQYREDGLMPAMFLGWAPDYADPDNYLQPFYHSAGTYAKMIGYENKTLDDAIIAASLELDEETRAQMYEQLMLDMHDEALFAWTAQATNFFVGQSYIEGYYFNPMFSNLYYYDLEKSSLDITLDITVDIASLDVGTSVIISGEVRSTVGSTDVKGVEVELAYSPNNGVKWFKISSASTTSTGSFSTQWGPSETGVYLIRATLSSGQAYCASTALTYFAIATSYDQDVVAVHSSSAITALRFNSDSRELSFKISSESSNSGFVRITIDKELVQNGADITVSLDGADEPYELSSTDTSWILHFDLQRNTHCIVVSLDDLEPVAPGFWDNNPLLLGLIAFLTIVAIAGAALALYKRGL